MSQAAARGPGPLEVRDLGRLGYAEAHRLQQELVEERLSGGAPDRLLLVEHDPVVTVGRSPRSESRAELEALLAGLDCPVVEVERGGEATWHGPGQLVAYPLQLLGEGRRDLHAYLRDLEQVVIRTLAAFGVEGRREPGLTGVWIGPQKVASIGVAVRRWVTWHGIALNLTNDLAGFRRFHPCGLDAGLMTRLADHVPAGTVARADALAAFEAAYRETFSYPPTPGAGRVPG
ncbi:MAG: lipoyl(octanoyl) transferase LipB [Planctomycetota bacterium]|nr:lipoyl(octanoyl) transferase LipB [Planctomycetota bacterium]